jgi:adenylate kinase
LIHRHDDTEAVISERLLAYGAQTLPLVNYYRGRGLLTSVDAMAEVDEVSESIKKILNGAEVSK